jgi:hypothetical protein
MPNFKVAKHNLNEHRFHDFKSLRQEKCFSQSAILIKKLHQYL